MRIYLFIIGLKEDAITSVSFNTFEEAWYCCVNKVNEMKDLGFPVRTVFESSDACFSNPHSTHKDKSIVWAAAQHSDSPWAWARIESIEI